MMVLPASSSVTKVSEPAFSIEMAVSVSIPTPGSAGRIDSGRMTATTGPSRSGWPTGSLAR